MSNDEIGRIDNSGRHHGTTWGLPQQGGSKPPANEAPTERPITDQVDLTTPHHAALRLLRERVLEVTRKELQLSREACNQQHFAAPPAAHAEVFVGRLISSQNLMAGQRRGKWSNQRIDTAMKDGMVQGTEETLEILFELDDLDADTWSLIGAVLHEFHRKVLAAMDLPQPPSVI